MGRVSCQDRSESPCLVRGDTEEAAEHGPGAGLLISKQSRVRPLMRDEAGIPCEARWYRGFIRPWVSQGRFFIQEEDYERKETLLYFNGDRI